MFDVLCVCVYGHIAARHFLTPPHVCVSVNSFPKLHLKLLQVHYSVGSLTLVFGLGFVLVSAGLWLLQEFLLPCCVFWGLCVGGWDERGHKSV